jgi:hypothetical protein
VPMRHLRWFFLYSHAKEKLKGPVGLTLITDWLSVRFHVSPGATQIHL